MDIQQDDAHPVQFVFVDGSFGDLAQEMADTLHISDDVKPLIEKEQKDEVLKKIIIASTAMNTMPEKEFTAAYNLLIYLVSQSESPAMFLPRVCDNLMKPIVSSPANGQHLALNALTTIFNMLPGNSELRFNVFMAILRFVKMNGLFSDLKGTLPQMVAWFREWDTDEEDQRKLLLEVADVASDAGDEAASYEHVIKALRTFDEDEIKSDEAQQLALRAVKAALQDPIHYDFQDVLAIPAVRALADSHPVYYELLIIFAEKDLEDYSDFNEEHEGFLEKEHLNGDKLKTKMRLLTFASLAASINSREIPYDAIVKALQIPVSEVELWTIDVIRAGLVEGRLNQVQKVFKLHRTTYRVFGEKQWREVGDKLDNWKSALTNVLATLKKGQAEMEEKKKRDTEELEKRLAQTGIGGSSGAGFGSGRRGGGGGGGGDRSERAARRERTEDDD
ncbi:PCI-domain-containing protein [Hypoxylon fuscum]|nr:PCI-domain-containing protein [Hypoxylon fuscum]